MNLFGTPLQKFKKRTGEALSTFSSVQEDLENLAKDIDAETGKEKKAIDDLKKQQAEKEKSVADLGEEKKTALTVVANIKKILSSSLATESKKDGGKEKK